MGAATARSRQLDAITEALSRAAPIASKAGVGLADVPGRHEPGTGKIDWLRQLAALRTAGYAGPIGLEYMPSRDTPSSLEFIRRSLGDRG